MSKEKTQAVENGAEAAAGKTKAAPKAAEAGVGFGDLEKVREILFGAQSRQIQDHFQYLEDNFMAELAAVKDALDRRIDALEASVQAGSDAFGKQLADEKQRRADADKNLGKDLKALDKALHDHRAQLDDHVAETADALRAALREASEKAAAERTARFDELSAQLQQAVAALRHAKTDRIGLADLFDHLAAQLRNSEAPRGT